MKTVTLYTDPKDKQVIKVMDDDAWIITDSGQLVAAIIYYCQKRKRNITTSKRRFDLVYEQETTKPKEQER